MNKKIDNILSQDLNTKQYAIKFANVMVDEIFKSKYEVFNNATNKTDRRKSVLRHFKDYTFIYVGTFGTISNAGHISCYSDEQLKNAHNLRGRKFKRKKHASAEGIKIGSCRVYKTEGKWLLDQKIGFTEYRSIAGRKDIGEFYTNDSRMILCGTVAHELAHTICNFIKRWAKHGRNWENSIDWGVNPLNQRLARLPWRDFNNNLDISSRYTGHQKGWQEIYKILRENFVNDYVTPRTPYKLAAKSV